MTQDRYDYTSEIRLTPDDSVIEQLHHALSCHLQQINDDALGKVLISERCAAETLGVNRSAVHKVYELLRADGLLFRASKSKSYQIQDFRLAESGKNIGIVLPGNLRAYWRGLNHREMRQELFCGVCDRASKEGLGIRIINLPPGDCLKSEYEKFLISTVPSLLGIIHFGDRGVGNDHVLEQLWMNKAIPQVLCFSQNKYAACGYVSFDIRGGIQSIAQHLLELGQRKIALFFSAFKKYPAHYSLMRPEEILQAFQSTYLDVRHEWTFPIAPDDVYNEIDNALDKLLAAAERPSAIWCRNDWYAIEIIQNLRNRGIRVPEDFIVIGTDDLDSAKDADLTSLGLPFYNIGYHAVEMLLAIRRGRDNFQQRSLLITPSLTIRGSSRQKNDI